MADILIDKRATNLDISDAFDGYSRVIIKTGQQDENGNDIAYISGTNMGRTLEIENPWGNQTIADNILAKIQGWAYQPLKADGTSINPAFEVGDSIVVNNVFSGIYSSKVNFSRLFLADVEAPVDKEIDHEYEYEDSRERTYTRKLNNAIARLNFFADSIEAKVDKVNENSTFGWRLTENGWTVFNQTGNIFSVDAGGASVTGEIKANTGSIGGFTIGSRGISSNNQSYGGQEATGVYIGTDGIQLGTKFRVDSQGNLYASSGTFDGEVYASSIRYGTGSGGQNYGYLNGGAISPYSIDVAQFVQGVRDSLDFADFSHKVFNKESAANYILANDIAALNAVNANKYYVTDPDAGGVYGSVNVHTHFFTVSGNTVTIGAPDFTGAKHSFSVAPSTGSVTISLNGGATYQSSYNRYAVPVKATDQNGNTIGTGTVYVSASAAYNKGYDDGQNEAITEIYITMISGSAVGVRAYHGSEPYTFKWLSAGDSWNGWD